MVCRGAPLDTVSPAPRSHLLGCVTSTPPDLKFSTMYCGTCVLFPDPVAPLTTVTREEETAERREERSRKAGREDLTDA